MILSDTSVRRPVMAVVCCALLVAFGLLAFDRLPLREYPDIDPPILNISTLYPGASAAVVENKITELIEDRLSGLEGMKTMTSSSMDGRSQITLEFDLDRDIDNAANDVRDRLSRLLNNLPDEADPPEVQKSQSDEQVIFWAHLVAPSMDALALTDYAKRYLEDRFSVLDGVARVMITGEQEYAMRIWLNRNALVARQLTVGDVENAIRSQNVELPAGTLNSIERDFIVRIDRSYNTPADFAALVLSRGDDGHLVRLGDVARVELASAEHRSLFRGNGESMVGLGIIKQSTANALSVSALVTAEIDRINAQLPAGMEIIASFDNSIFVAAAIKEVYQTLIIAAVLVVLVIFLFLGDPRSLLVPALTVPISLVSSFTALWLMGYSINLLTLLALVLAIGLVVDDSIVVLENVHRRLVAGESPMVAAFRGTRQVGFAVIATTLVLAAVFVPITFLEGDLGRLFGEFAVTMAIAVLFSSFVALTLAPVICSKLLSSDKVSNRMANAVERLSLGMERRYQALMRPLLTRPWLTLVIVALSLALAVGLFRLVPQEYSPREDRGILFMGVMTPEGSSYEYTVRQIEEIERRLMPLVDGGDIKRLLIRAPMSFGGEAFNQGFAIMVLTDWDSGRRSTWEIQADARRRVADLPGARVFIRSPSGLGGSSEDPVQFVVGGDSYEQLAEWQDVLLEEIRNNPQLVGVDTDLRPTKPQLRVAIDRNRAGDLGVSLLEIGRTLETLLGSRTVTTFIRSGREYDVILEGERAAQRTLGDLNTIYVRSETTGQLIPLGNLVSAHEQADAGSLNRYNRVRSLTLSAALGGDYSLGEALDYLQQLVRDKLPETAAIDYKGESLEYREAGQSAVFTFLLALLVVYLVMAAQFESFIHPAIILLTVPLALVGGIGGLLLFDQTLNIYSQVGMIMLVGLATKNGILIVEFINQMRDAGMELTQAVLQGASRRLRPIAMTAFTTVIGAIPLVVSSGPGHEVRTVIGVVVMCGVTVSTLITLLLIPMAYMLLARNTHSPGTVSRALDGALAREPDTLDQGEHL
ncbi:efflux RND transporter permease subunit [Parahaliea mediterranea]|uniref:efflux RND transporter permease subunit n=1 Tax=Parahaliea mediterranea TaxID=651086 RepID=UPI000E2F79FB|nr:efflux RND transporter permease subunit [Parahaliea mediterranea]